MYKLFAFVAGLAFCHAAFAQTATPTDSVAGFSIDYDIVRKVDGQNIRIVIAGDAPGGNEGAMQMPSTITLKQTAGISTAGAFLSEPQMPMPKLPPGAPEGADVQRVIIRPVKETFGMDFEKRTMTRLMTSEHDPEHKTYANTTPLTTPTDWKADKKTKKIAGYTCNRATCTTAEEEFTVWYTTELPGAFSPFLKVFPPERGVVLGLESDEQSFTATAVRTSVKVPAPAVLPADAVILTPDELKAKRREFVQKAMPQGGSFQMRRN